MKITDIDVSLSHGQLFHKQLILVYFGMVVCCLFPILTIIMIALQMEWTAEIVSTMALCNILGFAFLALLIYIKIKNDRLKNKIKLWLDDAVTLKAYSQKIDEHKLGIQPKATKIQVTFTFDNNHYKRQSTYKVFGGYEGCVGCFNKYADKEVDILYSPKYDEVMILKD